MEKKIPVRSEADPKYTWALEDVYANNDVWKADLEKARALPAQLAAYKGHLGDSAQKLLEFLQLGDDISVLFDALYGYAQRRSDEDTANSLYQGMTSQAMSAMVAVDAASSFETPELLAIPDDKLEQFYQEEPALETYRLALTRIRSKRAHILSDAEEKLLAAAGEMSQAPDSVYSVFADADLKFPSATDKDGNSHPVTHGTYIPLMHSADRVLRKSAFASLYSVYGQFRNTAAALLSAQVKQLKFYADARKYDSTLQASLDGNYVPTEVYTNLISAVHENMAPMYRYVDLRRKLLGVDELHMYDLYTPIVSDVDVNIPYEEAKQTVYDALACMGDDYRAILKEGFDNRWIDVYENVGKCSGAYSAGLRKHPYVLLNYSGTLDSMFTLAHEMGHAIHSYLSNKHQPIAYSNYSIFVAEVASTCNEALLMQHLLKTTEDKKRRAYLINYFLEQFRTTLYRQTMFAEFELEINRRNERGESLTAESLNALYHELNHQYFGDDIVIDKEIDLEWARIPHFYYDYYVYQYATGYSAAIALSRRILKEGAPAVKDYIHFLSGGCSTDPISLLRGAGVDMASTAPIHDALQLFDELITEMEQLMEE
ncbi:oligoendopeptidase F [Butyricicoccus intestinisimiae]|uniref:Oligopeptidase F n=1 Tax=Butyricicoccus intestinisimiae TaxID=2841509 RepID=A0ABS6ESF1_9FIRM|nr:oligoendopeptidase F [Butyricicoccus intestinisimiae]MBU5490046.1 oligoendopeptidase F [Butyricicoccus intestinisimiae]